MAVSRTAVPYHAPVLIHSIEQQVATPTPAPEEVALISFAKSTIDLLTFWPALRIAFQQGFGQAESRTHLAEDVVDLFYTTAMEAPSASTSSQATPNVPAPDEVEAVLMHVLSAEFAISLEDGSERLVARDLIRLWKECIQRATSTPPHADGLAEQFAVAAEKAKKEDGEGTYAAQRQGESDEGEVSDEDSEDDDSDEEMEGVVAEASTSAAPRTRQEPVIDEDGFQMVTKKGGRK